MSQNYQKTMKVHDTGPPVLSQIRRKSDGKPEDLTGASIRFLMHAADGTVLVDTPAGGQLPLKDGILRYDWVAGDTDTVGRHLALFEVVFPGGRKESYPTEGYMWFTFDEDLNDT